MAAQVEGRLAAQARNHQLASDKLNTASTLYRHLDLHLVGYALVAQGELSFNEGSYEAAVQAFEEASEALDRRRAPVLVSGAIPINLAAALGALGRQEEATAMLGRCKFDRNSHRGIAATELLVSGCLALVEERREEALGLFGQAATSFETLHRLREKALAMAYSVEAYAGLGNRARAIESATESFRLLQALGCKEVCCPASLAFLIEAAPVEALRRAFELLAGRLADDSAEDERMGR